MYKYEIITNELRRRIHEELSPGDRLPSIFELQEEFQVSYGSVRSAILILKAEGLVVGHQGDGLYVK